MHELKYPSLELSWVPKSLIKGVSTPRIFIDADEFLDEMGGVEACYFSHSKKIWLRSDAEASTLAHEWRHHWQYETLWEPKEGFRYDLEFNFEDYDTYWDQIKAYFFLQPCEMDALLFQHKMFPDECTDQWMEFLTHEREKTEKAKKSNETKPFSRYYYL